MTTRPDSPVDSAAQKPSLWAPSAPPFGSTWADFNGWVEWLDTAYELQLSRCWVLHEGLVHSLTALWHPWRSVYAAPIGNAGAVPAHGGPSQWHISHLYPFRDRLQRPDGAPGAGCRNRDHRAYASVLVDDVHLDGADYRSWNDRRGADQHDRGEEIATSVGSRYVIAS